MKNLKFKIKYKLYLRYFYQSNNKNLDIIFFIYFMKLLYNLKFGIFIII